jgi:antimicrobial peptide system SdpA family protein
MITLRMTRRAAVGGWSIVWALAVAWAATSSLPYNPLSPGLSAERRTRLVLPEGWGFFSRDPRERDLMVVRRAHGDWRIEPPHADASNLFGLLRKSRALPVEASQVISELQQPFAPCSGDFRPCLDAAPIHELPADRARPFLCGDVAFLRRAPVPWAWSGLLAPERMPTDVLRTHIRCDHD